MADKAQMMLHKMEKMVPSAEDKEKEMEGETDEDEEEETEEEEERSEREEDEEKKEQEKNPLPDHDEEKKEADVLNLNNEVVKMRKEVKRVRALIIRKLTRQIGALKKKKGNETEMERNQRRAARLLEEIHDMKNLVPDQVTKTALQKNLSFEQVCKNPKSTISDRAIARITTHPQFSRKIENIKAAVKAFKEERTKSGKRGGKEKVQNQGKAVEGKVTLQLQEKKEGKEELRENSEEERLKESEDGAVAEVGEETEKGGTSDVHAQKKTEPKSVRAAPGKTSDIKEIVKNKPPVKKEKPIIQAEPAEEESDLESSGDEEKEYFDDSTEERFHKQSSQSEESDDDDGFFVGKVSKFKKKKKKPKDESMEKMAADKRAEAGKDSAENVSSDKLENQLDELESRLKSKATKLESLFCPSLAGTKAAGGRGAGRGKGGDKFRKHNKDFNKQPKFQKPEKSSGSKYSKPYPDGKHPESEDKGFATASRGRGQGRGDVLRQKDHRGGGVFSHRAPQQALHPSWEASKRRKEQQGQILAFQGKKIKFGDDDD
ncbi:serum response factor-binding protein 1 isoform X1 [Simochromis diagramma]|uniref:serum response factor-binding protein 1 isoform X1 n=2 Tax=Simochromis diagramma TaxID=43689 RepID=UPI001A7EAC8C|nr:serum response factor-binding protein 1 isoform X1 [Simochromis diagramma]